VLILGEVHDNPHHHEGQAEAVAGLRPTAIVFEMLTQEQADAVVPAIRLDADALAAALGWDGSGWPDFAMYHPIFAAAPDAAVYGAGVPREETRRAVAEGAAAVLGADAASFGLDATLPEAEMAERVAEQREAHCDALPEDQLPGMVEAQRLRDAALARTVLRALDETGGPVAVITGNGHARRDRGIPAYLEAARPGLEIVSLGQFEEPPEGDVPFDFWRVTEPAERGDPCEAFR
jgi:uncharacterized iron-regulated protein